MEEIKIDENELVIEGLDNEEEKYQEYIKSIEGGVEND